MAPSDLLPGFQGLTRSRIPPVQGFRLGGGVGLLPLHH